MRRKPHAFRYVRTLLQLQVSWRGALICYALATLVMVLGTLAAAQEYPGAYDWAYTVISALASRKHNPEGAGWFAGAITIAMLLLWPVMPHLVRPVDPLQPRAIRAGLALRIGIVSAALVGVERLVFFHFSQLIRKGHEILALIAFLSFYGGVIGLYVHRVRTRASSLLPAVVIVAPLVAVGLRELMLYLGQRGIGWADHDWRGAGTPLWFSFALWQWLAATLLWGALGHLLITGRPRRGGM
jgi:hypothetical protein